MYKVKVDMVGFEKYTGLLGTVSFTDGISDRPVTEDEAARLGASVRLVRVDKNEQVGAATDMANARRLQSQSATVKEDISEPEAKVEPLRKPKKAVALKYNEEKLEEIANDGGIKAIRKIADEYDVKGVQISALIKGILEAQVTEED